MIAIETWKPVVGSAGRYEVSDLGRVRNASGKILKPAVSHDGYERVTIHLDGHTKNLRVNRAVLEAFVGPSGGCHSDHINGLKRDNRLVNLRWLTLLENSRAAFRRNGGIPGARGSKNHLAVFNEAQVRVIRRCKQICSYGWNAMLQRAWGVSHQAISDCAREHTYKQGAPQ